MISSYAATHPLPPQHKPHGSTWRFMDEHNGATAEMPKYRCFKEVWALKIESVLELGTDTTTEEGLIVLVTFEGKIFSPRKFNLRGKPTPDIGWYFIQYADGYTSFSPEKAFEEGYSLIRRKELVVGDSVVFSPLSGNKRGDPRKIIFEQDFNGMTFYTLDGLPGSLFLESSLELL